MHYSIGRKINILLMPKNSANPEISHVFVLMLENRSFDHMLGFFQNASPSYGNDHSGDFYQMSSPASFIMTCDPHHSFQQVVEQLCGAGTKYSPGSRYPSVNNSGFVSSFVDALPASQRNDKSRIEEIMKCYSPALQLPVLNDLAENFAVCSRWFSSVPGPTWPNRFFVHAASSGGLDHGPSIAEVLKWSTFRGFKFANGSIFDRLHQHHKFFRLYRGAPGSLIGCIPAVASLKGIHFTDTRSFNRFEEDINDHYPFSYTFIEPNYGDYINNSFAGGESQHPMDDVRNGESLIKRVYEQLRNSPLWEKSLLIITYDEHGGFYDHVLPPSVIAPGDDILLTDSNQHGFTFEQYGVRVPAIIISAYTAPIIDSTIYDHASVPATLEALFGMEPLTKRDEIANNVTHLANLKSARSTPSKLKDVASGITQREEKVMAILTPKEETISADSGNLPGFLYVAAKAKMESKIPTASQLIDEVKGDLLSIRTQADARQYLEQNIPLFLSENNEIS